MNEKHTPGPWSYGPDCGKFVQIQAEQVPHREDDMGDTFCVANVNTCMGSESRANARLMAAAPGLLDALKECITDDGAFAFASEDFYRAKQRLMAISNTARAAIAKAEGR